MVALYSTLVPSAPSLQRAADAARARTEAEHDAGLVHRFNSGDETAFVEIVGRYHAKMHRVAVLVLRNHADAEEIAQDTFIRAHRALAKFRGDASLAAWLHRIALNLSRNRYWYFSRRQRHATLPLDASFSDTSRASFADLVACDEPGPAHAAATNEFAVIVAGCMARLQPAQREILQLRNVRQLSYREIAGLLGITIGTVKSRVARARENLRLLVVPFYANQAGTGSSPTPSWFESTRPAGLLQRVGD
ncbi:ECF RNA polymerase sigma factor SigW [Lacunisphaera limnophila]|uniref:ECF RNA polymerase sigma factor SigW n=1 Tax=Lacunisphaera limnophila TaxID=1838286 RepID=A0A1D8AU86_9BACT|nr:sigma-70 family RNA polymerase sigma factor [Lacunisphaera limnophila]AOS44430.1 ECF RNA polymerase sigma factor SigW [Lacunisphaera limnophila]